MMKTNPSEKRIKELRKRLSDIYHRRDSKNASNIGDSIHGIKKEIRRLGGDPHVHAPTIG